MSESGSNALPLERIGVRAVRVAEDYNHAFVTLEHLVAATIAEEEIETILKGMNIDLVRLKALLTTFFESRMVEPLRDGDSPCLTQLFEKVMFYAVAQGRIHLKGNGDGTDVLTVMLRLKENDNHALGFLESVGLTGNGLREYLTELRNPTKKPTPAAPAASSPPGEIKTRTDAENYIAQFTANLNKLAAVGKIDPLIGRADEVAEAIQIFARKKKNNPLLVGQPGCGKTAIVEGMAHRIVQGDVPEVMKNAIIYSLDLGALVAGTKYRGDFEERMSKVIKAMSFIPRSILFVDEIHNVMGAGATTGGTMDAANLLKPALSSGNLRLIGATTFDEFRKHFEKDRALLRRFGKIVVEEPSLEDAKKIIRGVAPIYAEHHGVMYSMEALDAAVDLTHKYVTTGQLPDKAIDIIDMAGARLAVNDARTSNVLGLAEIEQEVSRVAKIPETNIKADESAKLTTLQTDLQAAVFGQDDALSTLVDSVFIARAGLREENKPQGSFLFTGPTGTGKTECARQLAATLGIPLIKFDMSEYTEKHSVAKLIGAPPGYVGFEEAGLLTNAVETQPSCVLLLDEIEKAHPDIYNILLQVMDDGRLTSSSGKLVSFRNVWLIMTSNAGVKESMRKTIGFGHGVETAKADYGSSRAKSAIEKMFSPEFRNRLDAQMAFNHLTRPSIERIAMKFIDELRMQVADRKVKIVVTEAGIDWLVAKGYDPAYGGRPMKRLIADQIKKPLSRMLVLGDLKDGGKLTISAKDGELTIRKTKR